ncbi:hypothetical protein [Mycobacterium sp.]|uniref:hypothetical protein n=1 Tax=Mycobacterium sp. TaxID=1785 RepID=UPI002C931A38|nr:hypothetical protein [Mycobacterium sp.]HTY35412.1 hypothetical protein [Mycobacterium sp.]
MPTPKLPATLVAVLGVLATVLTAVGDVLPSPWRGIAAVVLAVLTALGVTGTQIAVRAHGEAEYARGASRRAA